MAVVAAPEWFFGDLHDRGYACRRSGGDGHWAGMRAVFGVAPSSERRAGGHARLLAGTLRAVAGRSALPRAVCLEVGAKLAERHRPPAAPGESDGTPVWVSAIFVIPGRHFGPRAGRLPSRFRIACSGMPFRRERLVGRARGHGSALLSQPYSLAGPFGRGTAIAVWARRAASFLL